MSTALLCVLTLLAAELRDDAPEGQAACQLCHNDVVEEMNALPQVHNDDGASCTDCHVSRAESPHELVDIRDDYEEIYDALEPYFDEDEVRTAAACNDCHELEEWMESIHGTPVTKKNGNGDTYETAMCTDCHGWPHTMTAESQSKLAMTNRCMSCHSFAGEDKVPTPAHIVDTYRDTIHGKKLRLGLEEAAGCASCHGNHAIFGPEDERSTVHPDNKAAMCGECHENVNATFASTISHLPHDRESNFWGWAERFFFSVLTAGVIAFLFFNVAIDLFGVARGMSKRKREEEEGEYSEDGPVAADDQVARLDMPGRIQHWMMMVSFTVCVLSGWPLRAAYMEETQGLVAALGGVKTLSFLHRAGGALMCIMAVYHVFYLIYLFAKGKFSIKMVPTPKDGLHLIQHLMFNLGLRKERPAVGKWGYHEKFDYWGAVWGVLVMCLTGIVLWWPVAMAHFLPAGVIRGAQSAHGVEALLAALAIFVSHFYNVHLRPSLFPMSYAWLTGRISAEALYDEHRAQYIELFGDTPPRKPRIPRSWHSDPKWSFAALAFTLVAGVLIALANASDLRAQIIGERGHQGQRPVVVEAPEPEPEDPTQRDIIVFARAEAPVLENAPEGSDATTAQWGTCLACHAAENWESSDVFAHKDHFEDYVDEPEQVAECSTCHESKWHNKMGVKVDACFECHDGEEIDDALTRARDRGEEMPEEAIEYFEEQSEEL